MEHVCCMLLSPNFPVTCNPPMAVTLPNIGVPQYIGVGVTVLPLGASLRTDARRCSMIRDLGFRGLCQSAKLRRSIGYFRLIFRVSGLDMSGAWCFRCRIVRVLTSCLTCVYLLKRIGRSGNLNAFLSDSMYLSIVFKNSTPPQNHHHSILIGNSKQ